MGDKRVHVIYRTIVPQLILLGLKPEEVIGKFNVGVFVSSHR